MMKKRIIAIMLVVVSIISIIPMMSFAEETNNVIEAVADNDTSDILSRFSMSEDDDGRVEVDKTVTYNNDEENKDEFNITLSALGQAFKISKTEETESSDLKHPDVVFVVDVSGSMQRYTMADSSYNRVYGTVQALNTAIAKLMENDPETRWGVTCYGTSSYPNNVYLPIGSYTPKNTTIESGSISGQISNTSWNRNYYKTINGINYYYKRYSNNSSSIMINTSRSNSGAITISNGKTGTIGGIVFTNSSRRVSYTYTKTLSGDNNYFTYTSTNNIIATNVNEASSTSYNVDNDGTYTQAGLYKSYEMFEEVDDKENRFPVIVLITDGVPTYASTTTWPIGSSNVGNGNTNQATNQMAGLTIQTAVRLKKEVGSLYDEDALYMTIGPGVDYVFGQLFLDPSEENIEAYKNNTTNDSTQYGSATAKGLVTWLKNNASSDEYKSLTDLADYSIAENFTVEKYEEAMEIIAEKIFDKSYTPVVISKTTEEITPSTNSDSFIYFEDDLDNMIVKSDPIIILNNTEYAYSNKEATSEYTKYTYSSVGNTSIFVYNDKVIWVIESSLLPLIKEGEDDTYISASPIRCSFNVGIDIIDDIDETFYTNDSCTAIFTPTSNNPYYKELTTSTLDKTENKTNTVSYVNTYAKADDSIAVLLGNNGKIKFNVNVEEQTLVLDYGLPVEYDITSNNTENVNYVYTAKEETGKYGSFCVDENGNTRYEINTMKFVATDSFNVDVNINKICGIDADIDTTEKITYVPAHTIYFEDNFVTFDDKWTSVGTTKTDCQAANLLGDIENNDVYGNDEANDGCITYSYGSAIKTTVTKSMKKADYPKATFSFTGTGFDIISVTDNESAIMTVTVKDADTNKVIEKKVVDDYYGVTRNEDGSFNYDGAITDYTALYQIPVIRITDLEYGNYDVTIEARYTTMFRSQDKDWADWGTIYVDAIRIYTPAENYDEEHYVKDHEGYAETINLNDYLVEYLEGEESVEGIMFIDGDNSTNSFEDLKTVAPNNEIYLDKNQSIAFKLESGDNVKTVQIGFKSISGGEVNIKVVNNETVTTLTSNTCTDEYYKIGTDTDDEYTITNVGDDIVSITNIQITYSSDPDVVTKVMAPNMAKCMFYIAMEEVVEEETTEETTTENIEETTQIEEESSEIMQEETTTEEKENNTGINGLIKLIKLIIEFIKNLFK